MNDRWIGWVAYVAVAMIASGCCGETCCLVEGNYYCEPQPEEEPPPSPEEGQAEAPPPQWDCLCWDGSSAPDCNWCPLPPAPGDEPCGRNLLVCNQCESDYQVCLGLYATEDFQCRMLEGLDPATCQALIQGGIDACAAEYVSCMQAPPVFASSAPGDGVPGAAHPSCSACYDQAEEPCDATTRIPGGPPEPGGAAV
jgi:hypothetical protein